MYAKMPENTPANLTKYKQICRDSIYTIMKGMYREPGGSLRYPFVAPGSASYLNDLWDWDSWLSNVALRQILLEYGSKEDKAEAVAYEQGCVLNALSYGGMDGYIPVIVSRTSPSRDEILRHRNIYAINMHKPCLAQHAAFIVKTQGGDA